ncbi:MAG: sigma-70 family RNA polymerase sigma factor [Lachnospiraceae bacterium]|nr:sigma-70 family RNA polymerase sigma factor [Lachnospiraceae bacterium]
MPYNGSRKRPPGPPEGAAISQVKTLLSSYFSLKDEIIHLEKRLAALPAGSAEEAPVRRALFRDRLLVLRIERAVYSLSSPRRRRLLEARYLEGMSWLEVAAVLHVSESTVYALHRKALKELEGRPG